MKLKYVSAALMSVFAVNAQANLVIDDFSVNQALLSVDTVGATANNTASGAGIIGGEREIFISKDGVGDPSAVDGTVTAKVSAGAFKFGSEQNVQGSARIVWDGVGTWGATPGAGLNLNLLSFGSNASLDVLFSDLNFPFTVNLFSSATRWSSLTLFAVGSTTAYSKNIGYDVLTGASDPLRISYVQGSGGSVDLTDVEKIEVIINDPAFSTLSIPNLNIYAIDTAIDKISVIPEPASIALIGLGLLGLGASRRRKAIA